MLKLGHQASRSITSSLSRKVNLPSQSPKGSQTIKLPDGRQLGFAEVGPATGQPVFYIPGCPDSRVSVLSEEDIANRLGIRLIGIDRPGFGLSTYYPGRKVMDFVDDFKHLRDHLGIEKYHMFSVSGGTAYLLACAKHLPRDQLRGAGIFIGVGPPEAGWKGQNLANRLGMCAYTYTPWLMQYILNRHMVPAAQDPDPEKMAAVMRKTVRWMRKKDNESLEADFDTIVDIFREVYRNGSQGHIDDFQLMISKWPVEPEEVDYSTIKMWYGDEDVNTPVEMGRYMLAKLPHAQLQVVKGETHFTMWRHGESFLQDLLKDD